MIALIDYGAGNLTSVRKGFAAAGADLFTPAEPRDLADADGIVVPGVGNFAATSALAGAWTTAIRNAVNEGTPLLGICLGMQWLLEGSDEAPGVPGLGIIPSNRGSQSRPDPSHPCGVAPGKRPRLTPNPAMIVTAGGGVMPFGTPGGDVQIQAMLQVVLNILQHGMEVQEAIEAPRFASYSFPSSFAPFDFFPGRLAVEFAIPQATRDALAAKGHEIRDWPEKTWLAGTVEVVKSDPASGMLAAGADPRRPAYAVVA